MNPRPVWLTPGGPICFPDPRLYPPHGLVAAGGDLSPERLKVAYQRGIFPWYSEAPILWWCPHPRAILRFQDLHISRSLRRRIRSSGFRLRVTHQLGPVMEGCADRGEGETWITQEMKAAYQGLADQGYALAYEVLRGEELVGGLYGVRVRGLFAAESKFHRVSDASKVALVFAVLHSHLHGATCFDVQFLTPHLASLGVSEIHRDEYLEQLSFAMDPLTESPAGQRLASPSLALEDRDWMPWLLENLPNFRGAGPG